MVSITCPCVECRHNGIANRCTTSAINLTYRNMATVNEGRVDMWICNKYELSDSAKRVQQFFEQINQPIQERGANHDTTRD